MVNPFPAQGYETPAVKYTAAGEYFWAFVGKDEWFGNSIRASSLMV